MENDRDRRAGPANPGDIRQVDSTMSRQINQTKASISRPSSQDISEDVMFDQPPRSAPRPQEESWRRPPMTPIMRPSLDGRASIASKSSQETTASTNNTGSLFLRREPIRRNSNPSTKNKPTYGNGRVRPPDEKTAQFMREVDEIDKPPKRPSIIRRVLSKTDTGVDPSAVNWNVGSRSDDTANKGEKRPSLITRVIGRQSNDGTRPSVEGANASTVSLTRFTSHDSTGAASLEGRAKPPSLIQRTRKISGTIAHNVAQQVSAAAQGVSAAAQDLRRTLTANPSHGDVHRMNVQLMSRPHRRAASRRHANHAQLRRVASTSQLVPSAPVPVPWEYGADNIWAQREGEMAGENASVPSQRWKQSESGGQDQGQKRPSLLQRGKQMAKAAVADLRRGAPERPPLRPSANGSGAKDARIEGVQIEKVLPPLPSMSRRNDLGPDRPDSMVSSIYGQLPQSRSHGDERVRRPVKDVMDDLQSYKNTHVPVRYRESESSSGAHDKTAGASGSDLRKVVAARAAGARAAAEVQYAESRARMTRPELRDQAEQENVAGSSRESWGDGRDSVIERLAHVWSKKYDDEEESEEEEEEDLATPVQHRPRRPASESELDFYGDSDSDAGSSPTTPQRASGLEQDKTHRLFYRVEQALAQQRAQREVTSVRLSELYANLPEVRPLQVAVSKPVVVQQQRQQQVEEAWADLIVVDGLSLLRDDEEHSQCSRYSEASSSAVPSRATRPVPAPASTRTPSSTSRWTSHSSTARSSTPLAGAPRETRSSREIARPPQEHTSRSASRIQAARRSVDQPTGPNSRPTSPLSHPPDRRTQRPTAEAVPQPTKPAPTQHATPSHLSRAGKPADASSSHRSSSSQSQSQRPSTHSSGHHAPPPPRRSADGARPHAHVTTPSSSSSSWADAEKRARPQHVVVSAPTGTREPRPASPGSGALQRVADAFKKDHPRKGGAVSVSWYTAADEQSVGRAVVLMQEREGDDAYEGTHRRSRGEKRR